MELKLEARVWTHDNLRELNDKWVEVMEFGGETLTIRLYDPVNGEPFGYELKLTDIKAIRKK
jgi:hypothetical protein